MRFLPAKAIRSLTAPVRRASITQVRTFVGPTPTRRSDLVQDLYLKELKSYKPTPMKASDADQHVQKFAMPKTPVSPEESDIAKDLKAYEQQEVEVEGQASASESTEEDWFEDEEEAPKGH